MDNPGFTGKINVFLFYFLFTFLYTPIIQRSINRLGISILLTIFLVVGIGSFLILTKKLLTKKFKLKPKYVFLIIWSIYYSVISNVYASGVSSRPFFDFMGIPIYIGPISIMATGLLLFFFMSLVDDLRTVPRFLFPLFTIIALINFVFFLRASSVVIDPGRQTTHVARAGYEIIAMGQIGYSFSYGLVILVPMIFGSFFFLKNKKEKLITSALFLMIAIVVLRDGYATSAVALAAGVIYFLLDRFTVKMMTWFYFLLFVLIIYLLGLYNPVLLFIRDLFPSGSIMTTKIDDVVFSLQGLDAFSSQYRIVLYRSALNDFLRHPIIGNRASSASYAHSTFFDVLAHYGVVGATPFIVFLVLAYRDIIEKYRETDFATLVKSSFFVFALLLFTKSILTVFLVFLSTFVTLPLALQYLENKVDLNSKHDKQLFRAES